MNPDILERLRSARYSAYGPQKDRAMNEAFNEIVALRAALQRFGDKNSNGHCRADLPATGH